MNDDGQAFPSEQHQNQDGTWNQTYDSGMSLRDYYAGQALMALLSQPCEEYSFSMPACAKDCYAYADYMLKERSKK